MNFFLLFLIISFFPCSLKSRALDKDFFSPSIHSPPMSSSSNCNAEWTILFYIQARSNLATFLMQNIQDLVTTGINSSVNVVIQWEQPGKQGTWRYQVVGNTLQQVYGAANEIYTKECDRLSSFLDWALPLYQAKKYFLHLSNHGLGILTPSWGGRASHRINIYNAGRDQGERIVLNDVTTLYEEDIKNQSIPTRSICLDEEYRTFINANDLGEILDRGIRLIGRPFDVLGMDACFMGMFDIARIVKERAHYFIASQDLTHAAGWDYVSFANELNRKNASPITFAQSIIQNYGRLYGQKNYPLFNLSAIKLQKMGLLEEYQEKLVGILLAGISELGKPFLDALMRARRNSFEFSLPAFIDFHSFCLSLRHEISGGSRMINGERTRAVFSKSPLIENLSFILDLIIKTIEESVLIRVTSNYLHRAKGLSLYWPLHSISASYQDGPWRKFLECVLQLS